MTKRYIPSPPPKSVHEYTAGKDKTPIELPPISDISVSRLIGDGLSALYLEMKNLLRLSNVGKLAAADARDLRDTVKLLFEIQEREAGMLRGLTDEQLQELAQVKSNGSTD